MEHHRAGGLVLFFVTAHYRCDSGAEVSRQRARRRLGYQFDEQMGDFIPGKWVHDATDGLVTVINQDFTG